jgi:molybdopterin synthase catalytic subunit
MSVNHCITDEIRVTGEPLDVRALDSFVSADGVGGRAVFVGAVRDHNQGRCVHRIRYEAFVPMAERVLCEIVAEAHRRFVVERVAVHHRTGDLLVGEAAVVVAVGARHRGAAFDACRYVIDELKSRAPIWKKEFYDGGDCWVTPTP